MNDWTGTLTLAHVVDGQVIWETLKQAEARAPIVPVKVSPRQLRILRFVAAYRRERGRIPSYAEIASAVELKSRGAVAYQLDLLEAKGLIQRVRGRASAITLNVTV
jgi:SOS-response transcriptional repressor LexA